MGKDYKCQIAHGAEFMPTKEMIKPGMRVRLLGFDSAYIPSQPLAITGEWNKHQTYFGLYFDDDVRFVNPDPLTDSLIPSKPHFGFTESCIELVYGPDKPLVRSSCAECGRYVYNVLDYLCIKCRSLLNDSIRF